MKKEQRGLEYSLIFESQLLALIQVYIERFWQHLEARRSSSADLIEDLGWMSSASVERGLLVEEEGDCSRIAS